VFTRTQVCQALGISAKTLYLWERQGRVPRPRRSPRGWRVYSDQDVARLRALLKRPPPVSGESRPPLAGLSARNQLRGKVVSLRGDRVLCEVVLRLGDGQEVSAVITRRSADRLGLRRGVTATAVIKATEVMLFR
jgi:molybdopterin-binding protein